MAGFHAAGQTRQLATKEARAQHKERKLELSLVAMFICWALALIFFFVALLVGSYYLLVGRILAEVGRTQWQKPGLGLLELSDLPNDPGLNGTIIIGPSFL